MAASDIDQKYLGRAAQDLERSRPHLANSIYQILGLSVVLSRKLLRARKVRRLDTTRDTRSLQLYHQIIWLSREGLAVLEHYILPETQDGRYGSQLQVLTAHLRASFIHNFCLFHNNPPVTAANTVAPMMIPSSTSDYSPPSPRVAEYAQAYTNYEPYMSHSPAVGPSGPAAGPSATGTGSKRNSRGSRQPALRDPINSVTSDASFLTNPYAGMQPGSSPPLGFTVPQGETHTGAPPGLGTPISVPHPSAFLFPAMNFIPAAQRSFQSASAMATALLPGAHPLRLTTAMEHAAFLWDCVHDHEGARQMARRAIRSLRDREEVEFSDEAFEDAAAQVQLLGKIMRRRSLDSTPRQQGESTTASSGASGIQIVPGVMMNNVGAGGRHSRRASEPERQKTTNATTTPTKQSSTRRRADSTSAYGLPAPVQPPTTKLPTPPRSSRSSRQERGAGLDPPPSVEGGPVGGIPPPRRRESTKGRPGSSNGGSHVRTEGRHRSSNSRRGEPATYEPNTPPRVPPKEQGYTPGSKTTPTRGKSTTQSNTPTKRPSTRDKKSSATNGNEKLKDDVYGYYAPSSEYTIDENHPAHRKPKTQINGNGVHPTNGYYGGAATDQRGKGER
jgi:hypothetical protein